MDLIAISGFFDIFSDPRELIRIGGLLLLLIIIYLETGFFLGSKYPDLMNYSVYFLLGFINIASAPVISAYFKKRKRKSS